MTRRIPKDFPPCPTRPANAKAYPDDSCETLELDIQVVTPMFGGGAEAGLPDPVTLIRPSSIRGHLRFWWRATRGAECSSIEELKRREVEIFGDTEHPSPFVLKILVHSSAMERCAEFRWNPNARQGKGGYRLDWHSAVTAEIANAIPYALFPFQGKQPKRPQPGEEPEQMPAWMSLPFTFHLQLSFPRKSSNELHAAMWGWINFGGVGARTRRGCGTLSCPTYSPSSSQPETICEWMLDARKYLAGGATARQFSTAFRWLLVAPRQQRPIAAWNRAIVAFRDFRQGSGIGRNGTQGRSFWPEPETIRTLTGQRLPKHEPQGDIPNNGFPRAEFGLPIVIHFKDGAHDKDSKQKDPRDTELYPVVNGERSSRMASPLLIKALAAADGTAVPLIAALRTSELEEVELVSERQVIPGSSNCRIRDARFATYDKSPLMGRSPRGSAIDAFIEFAATDRNFQFLEVQE